MSRRGRAARVAAGCLVTAGLLVGLGLTVELDGADAVHAPRPPAAPAAVDEPADEPADGPTTLEGLRCFRCHNIARYRKGEDFSHDDHAEVGHCHTCHAFEGHFQVTIRRQACEDCH